jgi:hypothetical protein
MLGGGVSPHLLFSFYMEGIMRRIFLLLLFCGCAAPKYERTNIELKVEVLEGVIPQAYLTSRADREVIR